LATPDLLLEINSFADPYPITRKKVRSYIGNFLAETLPGSLSRYHLDFFEVQVLGLERTFAEKLLSLIRHSYLGEQSVREKIRHLYDLARLASCPEIQVLKANPDEFSKVIARVKQADQASNEFSGEWLTHSLAAAPLFTKAEIRKEMKDAYQNTSLQSLIWDLKKAPIFDQAWELLMELSALL